MSDSTNFKNGIVTAVAGAFAVVQFEDLEGLKTKPIPVLQHSTGKDKSFVMPKVGDHVWVAMDENMEDGVVLGSVYSDADVAPETGDKRYLKHENGDSYSFDADSRQAKVKIGSTELQVLQNEIRMIVGGCTFVFSSSGLQVTGGDVKADSISLKTHKHGGVQSGSSQTSGPV